MILVLMAGTIFFVATPMVARLLYSEQVMSYAGILNKPQESAYVVVCLDLLPTGMMGMVLVAMFSATASSMDTGLNSNAAVIVRNILPPLRQWLKLPKLNLDTELIWGRRVTVLLAIVIILITLAMAEFGRGGIFELMLGFSSAVNFPMTLPFFLVMFIRNAPRCSALYSIVAGLAGPWLIKVPLTTLGLELDFAQRLLVVTLCSLTGFALSYVVGPRDQAAARRETEAFYAQMHTAVDFEREIGRANDWKQLRLMGQLSLLTGGLLLVLLAIPNSLRDRLIIMAMGGLVALIGALMIWGAHRKTD